MANDIICGVNWASMKKFARFSFGSENCLGFRKANKSTYIIYLEKSVFESNKKLVEDFESFFHVTIKPQID